MATMHPTDFHNTNVHSSITSPRVLEELHTPTWADFLLKSGQFHRQFLDDIRPFITSLPPLKVYSNLGPVRPDVLVYLVNLSEKCTLYGIHQGRACMVRALYVQPIVLRYILAAQLTEVEATPYEASRGVKSYQLPDLSRYTFISDGQMGISDKIKCAYAWAERIKLLRMHNPT